MIDEQMVEDVARAIAPHSFDPNRLWSALIDRTSEQVRDAQQNHVRDLARKAIAITGVADLRAALDAAQDEIERMIGEKETLRAERDDIQRRFDLTWAYAKPRVTVMTSVPNPASSPGGAS